MRRLRPRPRQKGGFAGRRLQHKEIAELIAGSWPMNIRAGSTTCDRPHGLPGHEIFVVGQPLPTSLKLILREQVVPFCVIVDNGLDT